MTAQTIAYNSLAEGEIRLITLLPQTKGIDLELDIRHVNLSEYVGKYETLSYTWGDAERSEFIKCGEATFKAGKNLVEALKALRHPDDPRVLWVDAVCINQADDVEKSQQVAIMTKIYQSSAKTIAYLGEETEDSVIAIKFIEDAERRLRQRLTDLINASRYQSIKSLVGSDCDFPFPSPEDDEEKMMNTRALIAHLSASVGVHDHDLFSVFGEKPTLRALVSLVARPWFRRAWVIQEFVVSRELEFMCGRRHIDDRSFTFIFGQVLHKRQPDWQSVLPTQIRREFYDGLHQLRTMQDIRDKVQNKETSNYARLARLLQDHRLAQCARPQDKIYALTGFSTTNKDVVPDYHAPVSETYLKIATSLVDQGDGRDVLKQACVSDSTLEGLPSWVPDWSAPPKRVNFSKLINARTNWYFQAGRSPEDKRPPGDLRPHVRPSPTRPSTCTVSAVPLFRVTTVGNHDPTRIRDCPNLSRVVSVTGDALIHFPPLFPTRETYPPTGEKLEAALDAICRAGQPQVPPEPRTTMEKLILSISEADKWTMMSGHEFEFAVVEARPGLVRDVDDDVELARGLSVQKLVRILRDEREEDPFLSDARVLAVAGRRIALMEGLYAGLVPDRARPGDWVVLWRGANVPLILRECGGGGGGGGGGSERGENTTTWRLIGDCYVHGVMQGEAFENGMMHRLGGWKDLVVE